jgi:nicotinamide phosphoribosyltransferase
VDQTQQTDRPNLLLTTDSYKAGHARAYPPGLTSLYGYAEARGGHATPTYPSTVFFGEQYYRLRYLTGPVLRPADVDEAESFWSAHFGRNDYFPADSWRRLVAKHGGRLPLRIKAVPEGTLVPTGNILLSVESTDPEFPWLVTFFETLILKTWYPTTIATQSFFIRQRIREQLARSTDDLSGLDFMCHDFGYRGCSSEETAWIGAAAHLLSFQGTDTVAGIRMLQRWYGAGMAAFSIPATEHSIISAFGRAGELDAFRHYLATFPTGAIACVSDTYDVFNAVEHFWGEELRDTVATREGRLVVRPDSGDYLEVVPRVLETLGEKFGYATNPKGYRVLDGHVRVIQGDAMEYDSIQALFSRIVDLGWSAENLVVGSGGGLLQKVNRDTCGFAFKATEAVVDGEVRPIFKQPVTDPFKKSKTGRMKLVRTADGYETIQQPVDPARYAAAEDVLETVFEDGESLRVQTLDEIRELVRAQEASP